MGSVCVRDVCCTGDVCMGGVCMRGGECDDFGTRTTVHAGKIILNNERNTVADSIADRLELCC